LIEREGPTGLIVSTTRDGLHPENETRLISLTLADGEEQTRAILASLAEEDRRDTVAREPWHALQRWIAGSDSRVTIPYALVLVGLIPALAVRLRRDTKLLLNLIRAHALLHQATRARDPNGRVVATLDDYSAVYGLVSESIAEGVQASVPVTVRQTVEEVGRIAREFGSASVKQIAERLKLDKSAALRRCKRAENLGFIRNEETAKGRQARYVLADALPTEQPVLPSPDTLASAVAVSVPGSGCTVAGGTEGYNPPPPSPEPVAAQGVERRRAVL
jgi:hypothetical protein